MMQPKKLQVKTREFEHGSLVFPGERRPDVKFTFSVRDQTTGEVVAEGCNSWSVDEDVNRLSYHVRHPLVLRDMDLGSDRAVYERGLRRLIQDAGLL